MSDGALSQDEIDALLAGVDSSSFGIPSGGGSASLDEGVRSALQDFITGTLPTQSSNLSMMTGTTVSLQLTGVDGTNREAFLQKVTDMAVAVKVDFTAGLSGEHMFVFPEEGARKIASLMNHEENIELDDMALSVIGEVVSQITGTQITALTEKTGNKTITSTSPDATHVPKAVVALPAGDFVRISYTMKFSDGVEIPLWEVLGMSVATAIASSLGASPRATAGAAMGMMGMGAPVAGAVPPGIGGSMASPVGAGGMAMGPAMTGGAMAQGGYGMMPGQAMFGPMPAQQPMPAMGAYGAPLQTPSVQPVQFPSLTPQMGPAEQGNIGLIMDVYMELTVELGRTKKLIKEILGMGEGTIIELDKLAGEPVDILVNHKLIAKGEVVVIDENFGVRVTEIVSPMERMSDMG
ncbi:flagellar motor switch protein FliN [Treponema sp. J25]|uniref:flagellar motor switch protein FliN n=1 Tax=Treponema sp. J25 TaxID=2094121 RepID=UPI00105390E7|nr:flagellar motor switch protein FliN [Treponema sp. J25]TCW60302.1 flagellar motor switch protein FliN [Treponema sp. J25]